MRIIQIYKWLRIKLGFMRLFLFSKTRSWIAVFVLLVILGLVNAGGAGTPSAQNGALLQLPRGEKISLLIADTSLERMKGLSNRRLLSSDEGMLFIFSRAGYHGIWMKEMNFPIDIIWFDERMKIVDIKRNIAPNTFPAVFYPERIAKYVLEVQAGFSEKHTLKIGDTVSRINYRIAR